MRDVFALFVCGQVQARTQATVNSGWGPKSVVVVGATLDGTEPAGAPRSLRRTSRNETCLSLTWDPPIISNGLITEYKVMTLPHVTQIHVGRLQLHYVTNPQQIQLMELADNYVL